MTKTIVKITAEDIETSVLHKIENEPESSAFVGSCFVETLEEAIVQSSKIMRINLPNYKLVDCSVSLDPMTQSDYNIRYRWRHNNWQEIERKKKVLECWENEEA